MPFPQEKCICSLNLLNLSSLSSSAANSHQHRPRLGLFVGHGMGHPLRRGVQPLSLMCALLAGVTGGYQHVPFVRPAPVPCASSPCLDLPQTSPSRSSGAFMWMPSWRSPATVETSAPRRERRRHISMWLFTSIRNVAGLPVRVSVAAARVVRSMCLYLRWPWSDRYDTNTRSFAGARGSVASLSPSPAQRRARERRIKTLVRLDSEGVFSSLTKCVCPSSTFLPSPLPSPPPPPLSPVLLPALRPSPSTLSPLLPAPPAPPALPLSPTMASA